MELYRGVPGERKLHVVPSVSIRRGGDLRLNQPLVGMIGTNWRWVELFLDRDAREIGIKLHSEKVLPHCHRLGIKDGLGQICCLGFIRFTELDMGTSMRCAAHYNESKRMIVVRLDERLQGRRPNND